MNKIEKDEILELLWSMKEKKLNSIEDFNTLSETPIKKENIEELRNEELLKSEKDETISLTEKGEVQARKIIRAHRLAERLVRDVLNGDFEASACEFEHTITEDLVDGICTLLGHPRECPHGKPIPEGECCKKLSTSAHSSVIPLSDLAVAESARIAYIQSRKDQQMHKMNGLQIRPGVKLKVHQKYPAFVIECEGMTIALDNEIAENIRVWRNSEKQEPEKSGNKKSGGSLFHFLKYRKK